MMAKKSLLELTEDELRAEDLRLRNEGYKIEAQQQAAFEKHVVPIRARKREIKHQRDRIATALKLRGDVQTPAQREVLAELLQAGQED